MKVIRLHARADLRLHDEPDPIPGAGEKMLQVKAVGICGSDLRWFTEGGIGDAQLEHPLVLGHEFAGITAPCWNRDYESGQRVAVDPAIPCRQCELCQHGHPNLCKRVVFAGHGAQDGALCERMAWDKRNLFSIPDSLTYADGAMLEPLGVAIHAVDLAHLKAGMTVGVFGCGAIGLLIVQLARLSGAATIVATDKLIHRVEAASNLGATKAILAEGGSEIQEVMAATGGRGVDIAFEVAGEQEAVEMSFAAVLPGGKVILAGIPANDRTSFPASVARRKGLTIKMVRRMKHTYPRAIELVSRGLVDVRSLVTHRFPLVKAVEAFAVAQRREGIKVIIEM
ncbi:MAG: alcohol dehydrogenase catalytic domain-containing protein [Anaerolineales bacterium]|nr:alcohol dehydrogenase catalytic domain-containing protein [Anaerolineales bacterium]